jgi:thiol-disulfide isomerase/thioredoxin
MIGKRNLFAVLASIIAIASSGCNAEDSDEKKSYVTVLSDETFEHLTQAATGQTTGKWFVNFQSNGCGHCQRLAPIWEDFGKELAEEYEDSGVIVAKVSINENRELAQRFNIESIPTLVYFADRKMYKYEGERALPGFVDFAMDSYKESDALDVPPGPPAWIETMRKIRKSVHEFPILTALLDDFEHIIHIRKNAAVALFLLGTFFGFMVATLLSLGGRSQKVKKD